MISQFSHAPFKADLIKDKAENEKNSSSIVIQARFKINFYDIQFASRLIISGDADHYIWKKIIEKTEENNREEALKWDLFLAPHHCSWTYFNDVPYDDLETNKIAQPYSIKLIKEYRIGSGKVIASSKIIKNNDDNPPHQPTKEKYIECLGSNDDFISLAIVPKPSEPKPIIFEITSEGPVRIDGNKVNNNDKFEAATILATKSVSSGNWCVSDEF